MKLDIILAGIGGQGTVLASKLLATAALERGLPAHTAETIGMAQRGGSVVSHVRIGEECYSPLIPLQSADMIIGFEPAEAVRAFGYLKPGGIVVASSTAIKPVTASLSNDPYDGSEAIAFLRANVERLTIVGGADICGQCGSARVLNVALLGAAARYSELGMDLAQLKQAVTAWLAPKLHEINLKAAELGYGR